VGGKGWGGEVSLVERGVAISGGWRGIFFRSKKDDRNRQEKKKKKNDRGSRRKEKKVAIGEQQEATFMVQTGFAKAGHFWWKKAG